MVQPFEKALEEIAQNSKVMATQMPIIADSVKKIYEIEKKEDKKEDKKKVEQERIKADRAGGRGPQAKVLKGLGDVTNQLKSLQRLIKKNHKEEMKNSGGGGFGLTDLLSFLPGGGILKKLLFRQEGGLVYKSPIQAFQKGGGVYTVPGNSTGDRHPMMLPAGSFVLNRNASKYVNALQEGGMVPTMLESGEKVFSPGNWDGLLPILNKAIPRFQSGGYVGTPRSELKDTGLNDYKGRDIVLSPAAAKAFKQMVSDGMPFKANDVTNVYRDEKEYLRLLNAGYKPAANSHHNHGTAADIHGGMNAWIRKHGSKYGWSANDYSGSHGGHFEFKGSPLVSAPDTESTPTAVSANDEGTKEEKPTETQKNDGNKGLIGSIFEGGKDFFNWGADQINENLNTQIPLIPGSKMKGKYQAVKC